MLRLGHAFKVTGFGAYVSGRHVVFVERFRAFFREDPVADEHVAGM